MKILIETLTVLIYAKITENQLTSKHEKTKSKLQTPSELKCLNTFLRTDST